VSSPMRTLYRRVLPSSVRQWLYITRFFLMESRGITQLAGPAPARMWLAFVRMFICVKGIIPLRQLRRALLPIWVERTGRVCVTHWSDLLVLREIFQPPGDYEFVGLPERPGMIVDLGANIGLSARFFCDRYPDARIVAYEPDPEALRVAQRNVRNRKQISLRAGAVAASPGPLRLHRFPGGSWGTSTFITNQEATDTFTADAVTLDSIIAELGDVDILKIDIEGAEHEVLKACRQLDRVRYIIGEFHAVSEVTAEQFFALLDAYEVVVNNVQNGKGTFFVRRRARSPSLGDRSEQVGQRR
jgi:FkbM family methyltransferase